MDVEFHHHIIDRLAFANAVLSGIALYPQVWIVLSTGSADGVSFATFAIILVNSLVWLVYALHRGLISLGISSVLNVVASAILTLSVLVFR